MYWVFSIKFYTYQENKKYDDAIEFSNLLLEKFPDKEIDTLDLLLDLYKEMDNANKVKEIKERIQKLKDLK